jgi:hypothetical protein
MPTARTNAPAVSQFMGSPWAKSEVFRRRGARGDAFGEPARE